MKRLTNLAILTFFVVLQLACLAFAGDLVQSPFADAELVFDDGTVTAYMLPFDSPTVKQLGAQPAAKGDPVLVFNAFPMDKDGLIKAGEPLGNPLKLTLWALVSKAGTVTVKWTVSSRQWTERHSQQIDIPQPGYHFLQYEMTPPVVGTYHVSGHALFEGIKKKSSKNSETCKFLVYKD
jgi:hypothetical protein